MRQAARQRHQRDVLLVLERYDHRFHQGAVRYAREHGWRIAPDMVYSPRVPEGWRGDGILAHLGVDGALESFVTQTKLPAVNVGADGSGGGIPVVMIDEARLAQMAAEHFLTRGFEHFACLLASAGRSRPSSWPAGGAGSRGALYAEEVRKAGHPCEVLDWQRECARQEDTWLAERRWLVRRLQSLPKPLSVFCVDDAQAVAVTQACQAAGIGIPEQVAVLGVNNDALTCEAVAVPVSSLDTDMDGRAYHAAGLLSELMDGGRIARQTMVPPKCLVTRRSSDTIAIRHPGISKALRYIWDHAGSAVSVSEVAQASGMSPRGLHKAFITHLHRPPHDELQRVRIERAARMLRETSEKTAVIAREAGYDSAKNMFRAFRRHMSMTPTQYRRSQRRTGLREG